MSSDFGRGGELNTIIGKNSKVTGNMKIENSLRIDGSVKGDVVSTDTVVLGKEGQVEGKIVAKHVMLAGEVTGNVCAEGKVFIEASAAVRGDIEAIRLVIDEGAIFDGQCTMTEKNAPVQKKNG